MGSDASGEPNEPDAASDATTDASGPSCTTSIVDGNVASAGAVAVGYDSAGAAHVVYVTGSNTDVRHAVRSGGTWSSQGLANTKGASKVAVSIVGGAPRIAVAQGNATVQVFNASVGGSADAGAPVNTIAGSGSASLQSFRTGVDTGGVYHLVALTAASSSFFMRVATGGDWSNALSLVNNPANFTIAFAEDDTRLAIWTKAGTAYAAKEGQVGGSPLTGSIAPSPGAPIAAVAKSAAAVSILYPTATAWSLFEAGASSTVLPGTVAYGAPSLLARPGGQRSAVVFQPGATASVMKAVLLDEGTGPSPWSTTASFADVYVADLALRPGDGARSIVLRRKGATSDEIALVECP